MDRLQSRARCQTAAFITKLAPQHPINSLTQLSKTAPFIKPHMPGNYVPNILSGGGPVAELFVSAVNMCLCIRGLLIGLIES